MASNIQRLYNKRLIPGAPAHIDNSVHYECIMGSVAYNCSSDTSDCDLYGWSIPPKELLFGHLRGEIPGFGKQTNNFETFHKVGIKEADTNKEFDITLYSVIKFFDLVYRNGPNMLDALFVPQHCITHITSLGQMVRDKRNIFLSKKCWRTFCGYAEQQAKKVRDKTAVGKRKELIDKHGYDTKFSYHILRLMEEARIILTEGTLELGRNNEEMKAIRRGDWTLEYLLQQYDIRRLGLEQAYNKCTLPEAPPEEQIRQLLLNVLEEHFGSIDQMVKHMEPHAKAIGNIEEILRQLHRELEGDDEVLKLSEA